MLIFFCGLNIYILFTGGVAGEGYTYLKSIMWWSGMILSKSRINQPLWVTLLNSNVFFFFVVIVGELCNFIAYAFTQAILVTPLGALSVVIRYVIYAYNNNFSFTHSSQCCTFIDIFKRTIKFSGKNWMSSMYTGCHYDCLACT